MESDLGVGQAGLKPPAVGHTGDRAASTLGCKRHGGAGCLTSLFSTTSALSRGGGRLSSWVDPVVGMQPDDHLSLNVVMSAVGEGAQARSLLSESSVL